MQHVLLLPTILVEQILQFRSGWTTYSAWDQKKLWTTVAFQDGGFTTAIIAQMMPELCAQIVSLWLQLSQVNIIPVYSLHSYT